MSEKFQIPAKPWGDAEIKTLMANQASLDNETRAELGLAPSEEAPTPSEEPTVEEPVVEEPTVETPETQEEPVVETEEANQEAPQEETVENLDSQEA